MTLVESFVKWWNPSALTHSVLLVPWVAHKASTRECHCCWSAACPVMVFPVRPPSFIPLSTVRLHTSFGHPGLHLPSSVRHWATLGSVPEGIQQTSPNHLHLPLLIFVTRDVESVRQSIFSQMIVLAQPEFSVGNIPSEDEYTTPNNKTTVNPYQ